MTAYGPAEDGGPGEGPDGHRALLQEAEEARQRRRAWVAQRAAEPASMPATASVLSRLALGTRYVSDVEELGGCVPPEATPLAVAVGMASMPSLNGYEAEGRKSGKARDFAALLGAMEADGYEPCAFEERVAREIEGGEWDVE